MIFKVCPRCKKDLTPNNCVSDMNVSGLWLHHNNCLGSALLTFEKIESRANELANGDALKQLEIDYYKERLEEYKNGQTS